MRPYAEEKEKVCFLCCAKHVSEIKACFRNQSMFQKSAHWDKWSRHPGGEMPGKKCGRVEIVECSALGLIYVGLGLINCVFIFLPLILVYSFRRLLCCWWGDDFLLPQNITFQQLLRVPRLQGAFQLHTTASLEQPTHTMLPGASGNADPDHLFSRVGSERLLDD